MKALVFIIMLLALAGCSGNAAVNDPSATEQTPAPSRTDNPRTRFAVIVPSTAEPASEPTSDPTSTDTEDPDATEPDGASDTEKPASTVAPATAKPASTVAPATAKPASTVAPATAKPASTAAPATAKPASTAAPATAKPASTAAPATAKPVVAEPANPQPVPDTGFPQKAVLEFSKGEDYTGRKLKEASGFDGSGFEKRQVGEVVQYWQETDAGIESAIEVNGRLLSLGIVSGSKERLPELTPSFEYSECLYILTSDSGTLTIYIVTGNDAYEALSLEAAKSPQVSELAKAVFWITETQSFMKVDDVRGEISFAKIDEITKYAHSTRLGMNCIDMLDKDEHVIASYAFVGNDLILLGEADKTSQYSGLNSIDYGLSENWRHIVKDSPFQLGETYLKGEGTDGQAAYYGFRYGSYPLLYSSTSTIPLAIEFARQHLELSNYDLESFVPHSDTGEMYGSLIRKALAQHPSSLSDKYEEGFASADNEHAVDLVLDAYPSKTDLSNLKIEKVCVDAFIFMVNKDNPVESLTLKQIKDIYTGKVTNWAELGGKNIPIKAYQRDATSSSQPVMAEQIMKGEPMIPQIQTSISWGMGQFRGVCAEYDNGVGSIGYAYIYQFNKLYKDENVKILKIDGIAPSQEALASGSYPLSPFSVSYYGAARESDGPDSVGHKFLEWILSAEGQKCVEQAGYVPAR